MNGPALGAHVSTAGGLDRAPCRAAEIDATALQIFTKQPQRWAERTVTAEDAAAFRAAMAGTEVRAAAAHDSYLINLASHLPELHARSLAAFRAEARRAVALGLDFLVTHPGNATGGPGDRPAALRRNAAAIAEVLDGLEEPARSEARAARGERAAPATTVLLETTAGSGSALGHRFEELAELLEAIPPSARDRVGICLDTAHVHAAGYDLRADYEGVLEAFDDVLGLDRLRLLHLNDSKAPLGSRVDRHANIGEGTLGEAPFAALMRDPRLRSVPRVIETPKGDDPPAADRRNLALLRRLAATG